MEGALLDANIALCKKWCLMQRSLAGRLRVLRARKGLSLLAASEELGIDRHTLRDLELGRGRTPRYPTLAKIAEGYDVPVEDLLEEEPLLLSLEELHAQAEVETDWLVKSEEEWRKAWEEISSRPREEAPREAVMAVFDLGDEYSAVRKRIAEQDPDLALPHGLLSGPYKQAILRWNYGIENAKSCGVVAGRIGIADTLNDLVKELGLEDEMRSRELMRKERGAEPLEGMQLAS
jgi:transcriptional regulator with XRE-family HTH domain